VKRAEQNKQDAARREAALAEKEKVKTVRKALREKLKTGFSVWGWSQKTPDSKFWRSLAFHMILGESNYDDSLEKLCKRLKVEPEERKKGDSWNKYKVALLRYIETADEIKVKQLLEKTLNIMAEADRPEYLAPIARAYGLDVEAASLEGRSVEAGDDEPPTDYRTIKGPGETIEK
jgi:hypothetical protein